MANPFLMDDDVDVGSDMIVNPFLVEEIENDKIDIDKTFVVQANNPFAGFVDESDDLGKGEATTTVSDLFENDGDGNDEAMSFFGTTIQEEDTLSLELKSQVVNVEESVISNSSEEIHKNKEPPPRPSPPSQQTQDLIFAVADQLDQASSQMLDRIPVTRTPSPVSMRDLHSPSPIPDPAVADLLDVFDEPDQNILENVENVNDNPFATNRFNEFQIEQSVQSIKSQPMRPPPPKPAAPPRPAPPFNEAALCQVSHKPKVDHNNEGDLFDMFGTTAPPKPIPPKTKEDILSLFESPAVKQLDQPDLLSDDLVLPEAIIPKERNYTNIPQEQVQTEPIFASTITEPELAKEQDIAKQYEFAETVVMHSIKTELPKRAPTPDIEITTVPDLPRGQSEEGDYIAHVTKAQNYESENKIESGNAEIIESNAGIETAETRETEKMDTDLDFAPPSGTCSANPFASPDENVFEAVETTENLVAMNAYADSQIISQITTNIFANVLQSANCGVSNIFVESDEFDAFSAKFDSAKKENGTILKDFGDISYSRVDNAWGESTSTFGATPSEGFDVEEGFDSFLAIKGPQRRDSEESVDKEFNIVIKPKDGDLSHEIAPVLAPPPPPRGSQNNSIFSGDSSLRINPFDKGAESTEGIIAVSDSAFLQRTDSQETPPTPLFDEDVSQPLEDFPRITYAGPGWDMQLRQPNKKKITGQRFWKKIYVRIVFQNDIPAVQLYSQATDKTPFQELPLQPSYSVSEISAQQFDQFGKIFTLKLQYIFYKERPGVRPGQVTKAERITNKLSQFAAYAIQGDYQGVKEFGSDLKKLGLPVEHAPQVSQLFKIGSMNYEDLKQFSVCIEEALFKITAHRDRALNYKSEEVQLTAVDEIYVEQDSEGRVNKQIARVRLFFLGFLSGMPSIELGLNDLWRQGKEVVGRHDIIPVVTEEWIRLEGVEFHNVVHQDEYERSRTIKFQPPDACYIELMRFRVRPPKNRELPFQLKASWCVTGNRVELKADILVPGFASRKLGQIPCEDVSVRFPIPECWIYLFRVEKHFRYGSVKSAHRRTGKIKGIERILGAVETLQESLIEVTSGQAKYEHHHRAIVWRCPRLPKEGQGAYTTHQMVCRMALTSYDQIPEQLAPFAYVEFTMPATQVSHTTVRSVSVQDSDSDDPPEKYVRYLARHEYRIGIETTQGESPNAYLSATRTIKEEAPAVQIASSPMAPSDSDSESN